MKRAFSMLALSLLFIGTSAHAYNIKHSYSAPGNTVEFYGACNDGSKIVLVKKPSGGFAYKGPKGKGTIKGDLDAAAKVACGE